MSEAAPGVRRTRLGLRAAAGAVVLASGCALPFSSATPSSSRVDLWRPSQVRGPIEGGLVRDGRVRMGTVLEVSLHGAGDEAQSLLSDVFTSVERHERWFSSFDPDSDVSELNRRSGRGVQPLVPELARILREANALSERTDGAFDVTVAPLIAVWRQAGQTGTLPTPEQLSRARARVGYARVKVDAVEDHVELAEGTSIDLGAIGKGFALDASALLLEQADVGGALLSFGGSSWHAVGSAPDGGPWRVLLRDGTGGAAGIVALRDRALSVSESLGQAIEIAGQRFGHVVDPRSGRPLLAPRLVAVVSDSGARADALSTALLVLDPDRGLECVERLPGTEALLLSPGAPPRRSSGWDALTVPMGG